MQYRNKLIARWVTKHHCEGGKKDACRSDYLTTKLLPSMKRLEKMTLMTPAVWGSYLQQRCSNEHISIGYNRDASCLRTSEVILHISDQLKNNLTLSGSEVKREVWSCRGQPNPPVQTWVKLFLKKLLYFIVQNESEVPSPSFAPSLGIEKWLLYGYKLIARGIETLLVFLTWERICVIVSITGTAKEANYETCQYGESKAFHRCTSRLVGLAGTFMSLKGPDVSGPDIGPYRTVFNMRMALLLGL